MSSIEPAWIRATYEVSADPEDIEAIARALATEQSVEMPLSAIADQRVLDEVVGRVLDIVPAAPGMFAGNSCRRAC